MDTLPAFGFRFIALFSRACHSFLGAPDLARDIFVLRVLEAPAWLSVTQHQERRSEVDQFVRLPSPDLNTSILPTLNRFARMQAQLERQPRLAHRQAET